MNLSRRDLLGACSISAFAAEPNVSRLVHPGPDGRLVYVPDERGSRIPDFSRCGYGGGGAPLPDAGVRATLKPAAGDATERIQQAIDRVSRMAPDERGLRGAVLLERGRYEVGGTLRIAASGVVLRGEGSGADGTVLYAAGTAQRSLIEICGAGGGRAASSGAAIDAEYVPVGEHSIPVASTGAFKPGDMVLVRRSGNQAWIKEIAMDRIRPRPTDPKSTRQWSPFDLEFERRIEAVGSGRIVLDAPITCAIERRWGGGALLAFDERERIVRCGIENLRGVSAFDPAVQMKHQDKPYAADERHAWSLVSIDNANHVWVRGLAALHFGFACVNVKRARHVTVRDCDNREMVSELTGSRRYSFCLGGQLCLVERCTSDSGRHDFVVGARVCGPNAFVECKAGTTYAMSEPHHRWSVGGLYDNVAAPLAIQDRGYMGTGHGWSGANYVVWNCTGSLICQRPPTAQNWAIGHTGQKQKGSFEPRDDGWWESHGRRVAPASLYRKQLEDRR